jgi:hypothetical protein|tara:strand:- start:2224 stop:3060 length:837 start_codon:yes stop_codon:yes gene_type:complete
MTIQEKNNKFKDLGLNLATIVPSSPIALFILALAVTTFSASHELDYVWPFIEQWWPHLEIGLSATVLYLIVVIALKGGTDTSFSKAERIPLGSNQTTFRSKERYNEAFLKTVASHEVGHALTLALLPKHLMPDEISLHINEYVSPTAGALSYSYADNSNLNDVDFLYWEIVVNRAGFLAEEFFDIKKTTLSKSDRIRAWNATAGYLTFQDALVYFPEPKNDVEAKMNHSAITDFIKIVDKRIEILFEVNKGLLIEFRDELLLKKRLNKQEVLAFVNRI